MRFILCAPHGRGRRRRPSFHRCNVTIFANGDGDDGGGGDGGASGGGGGGGVYTRAPWPRGGAARRAPRRETPAESINKTIGYIHMFFKSTNAIIYFVLSTRGHPARGGRGLAGG